MVLILNIETTTTNCSVGLSLNGENIALKEDNNLNYSHAESLQVFIKDIFNENTIKPAHIDAVSISKGPGSYTGLRIGVSTAKGLCFALDKPLISVPTLTALASQVTIENGHIVAMLDARRLEVYSAIFNANHEQVRETQAEIINDTSFKSYLDKGKVYFIGSGAQKTKSLLSHSNAIFIDGKLPSAKEQAILAFDKYKKNDTEDVAYFEPYYLKDFIAIKS